MSVPSDFICTMAVVGAIAIPVQALINCVIWGSLSLLEIEHRRLRRDHDSLRATFREYLESELKLLNKDG